MENSSTFSESFVTITSTMSTAIWQDVLKTLEPIVGRPNFITWLKPTRLLDQTNDYVTVAAPNYYAKSWIERNVVDEISKILARQFGRPVEVKIVVVKTEAKTDGELPLLSLEPEEATTTKPRSSAFNKKYTFATFIVGNSNRLAFAAAQAVAEKPGEAYNPLFIYGGVGLGKTHLMQAIGNALTQDKRNKKIIYTSCENFTSEFINALQTKTINEFKTKYRTVDVLLVDDIQFLANKEGTQEEFFHTFNILHQANRQIVITADRLPKEINDLEERLISRFGWGMIADIQSPNFETRLAILQAKAKEIGADVEPETLSYIASTVTSNVRELEGWLTKLVAAAQLERLPASVELARRSLKDLHRPAASHLTTKNVVGEVARHFGIESSEILGKKRPKELVYPRQITMYLLRELLGQSYPQIGEGLGGKDHTTVMYGVGKITRLRKRSQQTDADLKAIIETLG